MGDVVIFLFFSFFLYFFFFRIGNFFHIRGAHHSCRPAYNFSINAGTGALLSQHVGRRTLNSAFYHVVIFPFCSICLEHFFFWGGGGILRS